MYPTKTQHASAAALAHSCQVLQPAVALHSECLPGSALNGDVGVTLCAGSGYRVSELASLCEGETLMIGGKEVEVMGVISAEDFARGRCFQEVSVDGAEAPPPSRRLASKPFCPPSMLGKTLHSGVKPGEEPTCRPRHDPFAPGV